MKINEQEIYLPRFAKRISLLFFPVLIGLISLSYYGYQSEVSVKQTALSERESLNVTLEKKAIKETFDTIVSDLLVLTAHNDMEHMLNDPDDDLTAHHYGLTQEFLSFIHHKKVYGQLRLINQSGQEVIRIEYNNGKTINTPKDQLQNKAERYYFKNTLSLGPGQVYVSPFDLNKEHGEIETPLKPVIRFAVPIISEEGEKYGILILNYLGDNLFHSIENLSSTAEGATMLINSDGYWLKGLKSEDEWGFMYDDRQDRVLANQYAEAWKKIAATESGQFTNSDGMFTYATIHPFADSIEVEIASENYYWKLISLIPSGSLFKDANRLKKTMIIMIILLSIVWLIICIIIAYEKEKDFVNELAIKEKDEKIREIINSAFDGIITMDENGNISSANPAACTMFGYREDELIDNNIAILAADSEQRFDSAYMKRYVRVMKRFFMAEPREMLTRRKDGTLFTMELCGSGKKLQDKWLYTGICRDVTERKMMIEKLEELATTDALTGAYNRGHFNHTIEDEFKRSTRYKLPLSLIIMDADHFKSVNDDYGHPAGDAFLIALANELKKLVRDTDIAARFGGEEFAVILPQTDIDEAMILAERIRAGVEKMSIEHDGQKITRTVSVGVSTLKEGETKSTHQLLTVADQALYIAKESGRNRVVKA